MAYDAGSILVRAVMTADSGLPEDVIINDFAFQYAFAADATALETACDLVSEFYRDAQANTHAVGEWISNRVDRAATHELQAWVITAPPLGSPDFTKAWLGPVAANNTDSLPSEVSAVLSFHADLSGVLEESGTTRPRARRRGRIFIGPLTASGIDNPLPDPQLDTTFLTTVRQAAVVLKTAAALAQMPWSVWSRTDATLRPVLAGWTDNAPDTQRRRGMSATSRIVWGP